MGYEGSHARRWLLRSQWVVPAILVLAVVIGYLNFERAVVPPHQSQAQRAAERALAAVRAGDLDTLGTVLEQHRGNRNLAYHFASRVTPRELGDILSSVAGPNAKEPLLAGVDADTYDIQLADLSGVLSLASHGYDERALPELWARDFATAMTEPASLYDVPEEATTATSSAQVERAAQEEANKQNLLLLLSRGLWSTGFLQEVTTTFWAYDHVMGETAWPSIRLPNARYAPAPNGTFLTDGILALAAALTANPDASAWAFRDFQPGTEAVDAGNGERELGKFAHYLFFEHPFAGEDGEGSVGMAASATALASAIDGDRLGGREPDTYEGAGPLADSLVLEHLAEDAQSEPEESSDCSWDPRDYWGCAKATTARTWDWTASHGHELLDVVTVASFGKGWLMALGVSAGAANSTWYAVEGDFAQAGLSLTIALAGPLASKFVRTGKSAKPGTAAGSAQGAQAAVGAADRSAHLTRLAGTARAWVLPQHRNCSLVRRQGGITVDMPRDLTRQQRRAAVDKFEVINAAAARGEVARTAPQRKGSATKLYEARTGRNVPEGMSVDHTVELQLGGTDQIENLKPMNAKLNSALGSRIRVAIQDRPYGTPIPSAAIC